MQRRSFLKTLAFAPVVSWSATQDSQSVDSQKVTDYSNGYASIIDLRKCDGCKDVEIPLCVSACKEKNASRFPQPVENIPLYFPRTIKEDYSNQKDNISRLTPYNWTYVENVQVDGEQVFIPRRCMHCDDPTCQKLCPFGVIGKDKNNAVNIDEHFCFGGAKCRDVCPWGIPQRQAGVGIYLKIAPKFAGGGAMFKCDMCADYLKIGKMPSCEEKCPKKAIKFAPKDEILKEVQEAKENGIFVYGDTQNGGTSTFYLSSIPFGKIDEAIARKYGKEDGLLDNNTQQMGRPHLNVEVKNILNEDSTLVKAVLAAPVIGVIAGAIAVAKSKNSAHKKS